MRKLVSILVAVGLVLGMVVMTTPAVAQGPGDWSIVTAAVTAGKACELRQGEYTFTFTPTAELVGGVHTITVKFPAGTGYPEVWRADLVTGHVLVNGAPVLMGDVTRVGDEVTFVVPTLLPAGVLVTVIFQSYTYLGETTAVINPPAGLYRVELKTSRAPNSTYVTSGWSNVTGVYGRYRILRTTSVFKYYLDFSPTYPGIAYDFVPPFKACGQNNTDVPYPFNTYYDATEGYWVTNFTIEFYSPTSLRGCAGCTFQKVVKLKSAPAGGEAHLWLEGLNWTTFKMMPETSQTLLWEPAAYVGPTDSLSWEAGLHFDKVGTYEMCFEAVWTGAEACGECQNVERCVTFEVKQWKDVAFIELYDKWNLMSLPIVPFDGAPDSIFAAMDQSWFAFQSAWHYDRCDDEWLVYGNGQESLEAMEAGKSYWVRMIKYDEFISFWTQFFGAASSDLLWNQGIPGFEAYFGPPWKLWLFGTFYPKPPASPAAFEVCAGWNMVGYLGTTAAYPVASYLWNWTPLTDFGFVYSWDASVGAALADWVIQNPVGATLDPGLGYWISFNEAGFIYPP